MSSQTDNKPKSTSGSSTNITIKPIQPPSNTSNTVDEQSKPERERKQRTPEDIVRSQLRANAGLSIPEIGRDPRTKKNLPVSQIDVLRNGASNSPNIGNFLASVMTAPDSFKQKITNGTIYYMKKRDYQYLIDSFPDIEPHIKSITSPQGYGIDSITYDKISMAYGRDQDHQIKINDPKETEKIRPLSEITGKSPIQVKIPLSALQQTPVAQSPVQPAPAPAPAQTNVTLQSQSETEFALKKQQSEMTLPLVESTPETSSSPASPQSKNETTSPDLTRNQMIALIVPKILEYSLEVINTKVDKINHEWETQLSEPLRLVNPLDGKINENFKIYKESIDAEIKNNIEDTEDTKRDKDEKKVLSSDRFKSVNDKIDSIKNQNHEIGEVFQGLIYDKDRLILGMGESFYSTEDTDEIKGLESFSVTNITKFNTLNENFSKKIKDLHYSIQDQLRLESFKQLLDVFKIDELIPIFSELTTSISSLDKDLLDLISSIDLLNPKIDDEISQLFMKLFAFYIQINNGSNLHNKLEKFKSWIIQNNKSFINVHNNFTILQKSKKQKDFAPFEKKLSKDFLEKKILKITIDEHKKIIDSIEKILGFLVKYVESLPDTDKVNTNKLLSEPKNQSLIDSIKAKKDNTIYPDTVPTWDNIKKLVKALKNIDIDSVRKNLDNTDDKSFLSTCNNLKSLVEGTLTNLSLSTKFGEIDTEKNSMAQLIKEESNSIKAFAKKIVEMAQLVITPGNIKTNPPGIENLLKELKGKLKQVYDDYIKIILPPKPNKDDPIPARPTDEDIKKSWGEVEKILQQIRPYDGELFSIKTKIIEFYNARDFSEKLWKEKNDFYAKEVKLSEAKGEDEKKARKQEANKKTREDTDVKASKDAMMKLKKEVDGLISKLN